MPQAPSIPYQSTSIIKVVVIEDQQRIRNLGIIVLRKPIRVALVCCRLDRLRHSNESR
jgi:hypothetical protein